MSITTWQETAPDQGDHERNNDPVLQLGHARNQALMLWSEAQRQVTKIAGAVSLEPGGDPNPEESSRFNEAHQRSVDFLDRLLRIEAQLYDTTATTPAGLIFQAMLLRDAVFPSDHEGRRLLNTIISGIERLCILTPETQKIGSGGLMSQTTINARSPRRLQAGARVR